uniref:Putative transcription initiation factor tfii-d subunit n=1 Tax=Amblyomma aureolatum TaxID=187763 RepID=A0A1E1X6R1_9ACAR
MNAPPEIKKTKEEAPAELESQFVLRLPGQVAAALRAAVRSGVMNLKDRLTIQLEPDNRHGTVSFDRWSLSARVVDLPSIIESHKTLDRKTFYKTADVAQLMICKEEDAGEDEEAKKAAAAADDEESLRRKERKDAKDKKYQHPHGITPSLKNVRKRRFRKVLKKKYVDFPEIEKEVKRLFRMDNEAISIRYEVVNADDDKGGDGKGEGNETINGGSGDPHMSGGFGSPSVSALLNSNSQSMDVGEHDLFGEALSSSDEDDVNIVDSGGEEELSARPPKQRHPSASGKRDDGSSPDMVTDFRRGMLVTSDKMAASGASTSAAATAAATSSLVDEYVDDPDYGDDKEVIEFATAKKEEDDDVDEPEQDNSALLNRLSELEREIAQLQERRQAQELEIASIENQALKQRFQNLVNSLKLEESEKQREYDDIVSLLHQ